MGPVFMKLSSIFRTHNYKEWKMKKINYNQIIKESSRLGISPHTLIKRKINYRKAGRNENPCKVCKHLKYLDYQNNLNGINCFIIGESIEKAAEINYSYTCDLWESINN